MKTTILILAAAAAITSAPAFASGEIAGATLPEQIAQELTLVDQYTTQAQQLQAQFQMVYNQAMNLQNLPVQSWPNASSLLNNLVTLMSNAKGLNYATQNTVAAVQAQYGAPNTALSDYSGSLQTWTGNLDTQTAAALQQYGQNAANFQTTQSALQTVENDSQSATGRMQVLQAGNQISGMLVNQMQSLQSDIQAGNQVQFQALEASAHSKSDAATADAAMLNAPLQPGAF